MKESTQAFLAGLLLGFLASGILITAVVTNPRKEEAIKRGYAEMKLTTPYSIRAEFTWK